MSLGNRQISTAERLWSEGRRSDAISALEGAKATFQGFLSRRIATGYAERKLTYINGLLSEWTLALETTEPSSVGQAAVESPDIMLTARTAGLIIKAQRMVNEVLPEVDKQRQAFTVLLQYARIASHKKPAPAGQEPEAYALQVVRDGLAELGVPDAATLLDRAREEAAETLTLQRIAELKETFDASLEGQLLSPKHDFIQKKRIDEHPSIVTRHTNDQVIKVIREAGDSVTLVVEGHMRLLDGAGSSLDLPFFQWLLTTLGAQELKDFPLTPTVAAKFRAKIRLERAKRKDQIEYIAADYKYPGSFHKRSYRGKHIDSDHPYIVRRTIELDENGKTRYGQLDAAPFIFQLFGLTGGYRVIVEDIDKPALAGGMESSNVANVALITVASVLSGADLSEADIFSLAIKLENDELGGLTGGQGHASAIMGGVRANVWPSGAKGLDGNIFNPYSTFSIPLITSKEGIKALEEHLLLVLPGKEYKNGVEQIKRTADLINRMWTDLLADFDAVGFPLHYEKLSLATKYINAMRRLDAAAQTGGEAGIREAITQIAEALNRYVEIRNQLQYRWMQLMFDAHHAREKEALGEEGWRLPDGRLLGPDKETPLPLAAEEYARKVFDETHSEYKAFSAIRVELEREGEEYLRTHSLYSYKASGELAEAVKTQDGGYMDLGAGGPGANCIAVHPEGREHLKGILEAQGYHLLTEAEIGAIMAGTGILKGYMEAEIATEPLKVEGFLELNDFVEEGSDVQFRLPAKPVNVTFGDLIEHGFDTRATLEAAEATQETTEPSSIGQKGEPLEVTEVSWEEESLTFDFSDGSKVSGKTNLEVAGQLNIMLAEKGAGVRSIIGPASELKVPATTDTPPTNSIQLRYFDGEKVITTAGFDVSSPTKAISAIINLALEEATTDFHVEVDVEANDELGNLLTLRLFPGGATIKTRDNVGVAHHLTSSLQHHGVMAVARPRSDYVGLGYNIGGQPVTAQGFSISQDADIIETRINDALVKARAAGETTEPSSIGQKPEDGIWRDIKSAGTPDTLNALREILVVKDEREEVWDKEVEAFMYRLKKGFVKSGGRDVLLKGGLFVYVDGVPLWVLSYGAGAREEVAVINLQTEETLMAGISVSQDESFYEVVDEGRMLHVFQQTDGDSLFVLSGDGITQELGIEPTFIKTPGGETTEPSSIGQKEFKVEARKDGDALVIILPDADHTEIRALDNKTLGARLSRELWSKGVIVTGVEEDRVRLDYDAGPTVENAVGFDMSDDVKTIAERINDALDKAREAKAQEETTEPSSIGSQGAAETEEELEVTQVRRTGRDGDTIVITFSNGVEANNLGADTLRSQLESILIERGIIVRRAGQLIQLDVAVIGTKAVYVGYFHARSSTDEIKQLINTALQNAGEVRRVVGLSNLGYLDVKLEVGVREVSRERDILTIKFTDGTEITASSKDELARRLKEKLTATAARFVSWPEESANGIGIGYNDKGYIGIRTILFHDSLATIKLLINMVLQEEKQARSSETTEPSAIGQVEVSRVDSHITIVFPEGQQIEVDDAYSLATQLNERIDIPGFFAKATSDSHIRIERTIGVNLGVDIDDLDQIREAVTQILHPVVVSRVGPSALRITLANGDVIEARDAYELATGLDASVVGYRTDSPIVALNRDEVRLSIEGEAIEISISDDTVEIIRDIILKVLYPVRVLRQGDVVTITLPNDEVITGTNTQSLADQLNIKITAPGFSAEATTDTHIRINRSVGINLGFDIDKVPQIIEVVTRILYPIRVARRSHGTIIVSLPTGEVIEERDNKGLAAGLNRSIAGYRNRPVHLARAVENSIEFTLKDGSKRTAGLHQIDHMRRIITHVLYSQETTEPSSTGQPEEVAVERIGKNLKITLPDGRVINAETSEDLGAIWNGYSYMGVRFTSPTPTSHDIHLYYRKGKTPVSLGSFLLYDEPGMIAFTINDAIRAKQKADGGETTEPSAIGQVELEEFGAPVGIGVAGTGVQRSMPLVLSVVEPVSREGVHVYKGEIKPETIEDLLDMLPIAIPVEKGTVRHFVPDELWGDRNGTFWSRIKDRLNKKAGRDAYDIEKLGLGAGQFMEPEELEQHIRKHARLDDRAERTNTVIYLPEWALDILGTERIKDLSQFATILSYNDIVGRRALFAEAFIGRGEILRTITPELLQEDIVNKYILAFNYLHQAVTGKHVSPLDIDTLELMYSDPLDFLRKIMAELPKMTPKLQKELHDHQERMAIEAITELAV